MGNKTAGRKMKRKGMAAEIVGQMTEYAVAVTTVALCAIVPLYAKDGYNQIGDAKFAAYQMIMLPSMALFLCLGVFYFLFWKKEKREYTVSVTDYFVLVYMLFIGISTLNGGFYKDALWGSEGWYMGIASQLSFVILYFFLSRFGKYYGSILKVLCAVSAVVFVLGILHRMQIDPIGFYDGLDNKQKAQFLSTLGQATWYASFLIVVLPIGIAAFLYADKKMQQILAGLFVFIGFCTLVTQNSDSAYFALFGFLLVFLWDAVKRRESLLCYMFVVTMFLAAGKLMYFLMQIHPNPDFLYDAVTDFVLSSVWTWAALVLCALICILLYRFGAGDRYPQKVMVCLRNGVYGLAGVGVILVILLLVWNAKGLLPAGLAQKLSAFSYLDWNGDWGNGRGRIWTFCVKIFMEESLKDKLLGVGPDCLSSYIIRYYHDEAMLLWGGKLLTNAHNEWLNSIINMGIIGGTAYLGIFVSAVVRFLKKCGKNYLLIGAAASIVSYLSYNFFCYQQVLCTPFLFLIMGIGEYLSRE